MLRPMARIEEEPINSIPEPRVESATLAIAAPDLGSGNWSGAPSAWATEESYHLAYRLRRPVSEERGHAVVVATSVDGVEFEPCVVLHKEDFGAASLERPALVQMPDGRWRLYVSCATPGTAHWWIDAIDAARPEDFDPAHRQTVLAGEDGIAMKDPVVKVDGDRWMLWVCCHPLADPAATDRMSTRFATSADGLMWALRRGDAVAPSPGTWFSRGTRIADVLELGGYWVAYFDGRASADENAEERTGIAVGTEPGRFEPQANGPVWTSPDGTGSLRYLSVLRLRGGGYRLYFEAATEDGGHSLFTQLVAP